ncbi:MAG: chloride channel protein [Vicinamibacterales bacterium]
MARHVFLVAAPVGALVGTAVAGYDYVVNVLLWERLTHTFSVNVLSLLPIVAMVLTGVILELFRVTSSSMADEVVMAYHQRGSGIPYGTAIPKLVASVATMGFGASAGMEGASKWLGGTLSSYAQVQLNRVRRLRWFHGRVETTMLAGAAAGISAIFRAPLTGAIMGIESPYKHDLAHEALVQGLVAAATSYATFAMLRPATPYFPIDFVYQLNWRDLILCVPLGIVGGLASHLFLACLKSIRSVCNRSQAPRLLKLTMGGVALSGLAWVTYRTIGQPVTLQAGLPVANALLKGHFTLTACVAIFVAKLLATSITFGTGGVGGLFVPSATIGAALGATFDALGHPSQPGLFTLVGIAAFTGASYNSLLFAAVFVAEATGSPALVVPSLIASSMAFLVSAGISNSESQRPRRATDEAALASLRCGEWMTTRIVVAHERQTLDRFMERAIVEHGYSALPVVGPHGRFVGMTSLRSLRAIPRDRWSSTPIGEITDRNAKTVCAAHSMANVEQALALSPHNYVPVVDEKTDQLIGILSSSDVTRAREQVRDIKRIALSNVTVMHPRTHAGIQKEPTP